MKQILKTLGIKVVASPVQFSIKKNCIVKLFGFSYIFEWGKLLYQLKVLLLST